VTFTNGNTEQPFADVVKARKEELGMSFRELSRATRELDEAGCGLSSGYLVQLFKGNEDPVPRAIELIAQALSLPAEDFVEYQLHEMRELLDERVDFERAVANLRALRAADAPKLSRARDAVRARGRRRQTVSR